MKQADDRWWFKYRPEFKQQAVDRMMAGQRISALARELGLRVSFSTPWREAFFRGGLAQYQGVAPVRVNAINYLWGR